MAGVKGMQWLEKKGKYTYKWNVAIDKRTAEKILMVCESRQWNISQAIRNILWWHFEGKGGKK